MKGGVNRVGEARRHNVFHVIHSHSQAAKGSARDESYNQWGRRGGDSCMRIQVVAGKGGKPRGKKQHLCFKTCIKGDS